MAEVFDHYGIRIPGLRWPRIGPFDPRTEPDRAEEQRLKRRFDELFLSLLRGTELQNGRHWIPKTASESIACAQRWVPARQGKRPPRAR